jgi:K+-transporting ATPase KdpF subunit
MRKASEDVMSWIYLLSGILALGVFAYLVVALLYPEKF